MPVCVEMCRCARNKWAKRRNPKYHYVERSECVQAEKDWSRIQHGTKKLKCDLEVKYGIVRIMDEHCKWTTNLTCYFWTKKIRKIHEGFMDFKMNMKNVTLYGRLTWIYPIFFHPSGLLHHFSVHVTLILSSHFISQHSDSLFVCVYLAQKYFSNFLLLLLLYHYISLLYAVHGNLFCLPWIYAWQL